MTLFPENQSIWKFNFTTSWHVFVWLIWYWTKIHNNREKGVSSRNWTCLLAGYQNARHKKWIFFGRFWNVKNCFYIMLTGIFLGIIVLKKKSVAVRIKVWERKNQTCLLRPLVAYQNARHKYDYCGLNSDLCDVRF